MKILGYSERGIINSLIFSIGEDKELMKEFIELIEIPQLIESNRPKDYTILLEQSFSGFGDADLIIIMEYESQKKVIFIEGKVKTFQRNKWSLQKQFDKYKQGKYDGYSSNLFFQLYLKNLLFHNKVEIKWDEDKIVNCDNSIANCGFRDRKLGKNEIVWKSLKKIVACDEAFYVGLVPSSKQENDAFNEELDYNLHFLSWKAVHEFCKNNEKLEKVKEIFDYNEGQIY